MKPRIRIDTYADGSTAILVEVPGDAGGYPAEEIGGAEVLRRFAAFPDLLAALKLLLEEWESIPETDPVPDEINNDSTWTAVRDAIAKAEGT